MRIPLTKDTCHARLSKDGKHKCLNPNCKLYMKDCETDNAFPDECIHKDEKVYIVLKGL